MRLEDNSTRRVTRRLTQRAILIPDATPQLLDGRYELQQIVGTGGMSVVYAAFDRLLERTVAIKMLKVELAESGHAERLRREAAAMARIDSTHVVSIHDIGLGGDGMYLVMQYIHGSTLEQEVERFGSMDPARACRIGIDILSGLTAVHSCGLVHRDLKPSNVMLDRDDRAILLDLGVALHRRKAPMTPVGMATGTPEYMAPEQLDSTRLDGRTDLYQLGRILMYLVTGLDGERDVADGLAQMPEPLADIARRAMAPLGERYTSTEKMRSDLLAAESALAELLELDELIELVRPVQPVELAEGSQAMEPVDPDAVDSDVADSDATPIPVDLDGIDPDTESEVVTPRASSEQRSWSKWPFLTATPS